jgi:putative transposase
MAIKRTSHTVYDTKYHIVWAPKYRKWILRCDIQQRVRELFQEIADNHDIDIDTMEIAPDHVHLFVSFPPRYSIANVVGKLKSISASVIFREFPEVKHQLWGGELWEDGYFVRTVGDNVTAEVIKKYIQYHQNREKSPEQLDLF